MANGNLTEALKEPVVDYSTVKDTVYTGEENILTSLSPKVRTKFVRFLMVLRSKYPDIKFNVVEGARSATRQTEMFKKGKSQIKTGGKHQKSMAIDAYPILDGKIVNPGTTEGMQVYKDIGAVAASVGVDWGGNWKTFKDFGHFEYSEKGGK